MVYRPRYLNKQHHYTNPYAQIIFNHKNDAPKVFINGEKITWITDLELSYGGMHDTKLQVKHFEEKYTPVVTIKGFEDLEGE